MVSERVWPWGGRGLGARASSGRVRLGPACRWPEACGSRRRVSLCGALALAPGLEAQILQSGPALRAHWCRG